MKISLCNSSHYHRIRTQEHSRWSTGVVRINVAHLSLTEWHFGMICTILQHISSNVYIYINDLTAYDLTPSSSQSSSARHFPHLWILLRPYNHLQNTLLSHLHSQDHRTLLPPSQKIQSKRANIQEISIRPSRAAQTLHGVRQIYDGDDSQ